MVRYPKIFRLNSSRRDRERKKFSKDYLGSKLEGDFPSIKNSNVDVFNIVKNELSFPETPFELINKRYLKYANIINGYRDDTVYFFKIDKRNILNLEIQERMPKLLFFSLNYSFHLDYSRIETQNFYIIKTQKELISFTNLFANWLVKQDFSLDT